jgi:hypothetical protein
MGASVPRRYRLQRLKMFRCLKWVCLLIVALCTFTGSAWARIIPFHGTLFYSASANNAPVPVLGVKAADGNAAYELTFELERDRNGDVEFVDLILRRSGTGANGHNLLEPIGNWHGYQDFMFGAWDYKNGITASLDGPTRHIHIKKQKLDVTCTVSKADVHPAVKPYGPNEYAFDDLTLEVDIQNSK